MKQNWEVLLEELEKRKLPVAYDEKLENGNYVYSIRVCDENNADVLLAKSDGTIEPINYSIVEKQKEPYDFQILLESIAEDLKDGEIRTSNGIAWRIPFEVGEE